MDTPANDQRNAILSEPIPHPDSPEFYHWALKLEYPNNTEETDYWSHSIEFFDPTEATAEAERRIAQELSEKTGKLDLRGLYLTELPASLFELQWLKVLLLGGNRFGQAIPLANISQLNLLQNLMYLRLSWTVIISFEVLRQLTQLRFLDLSGTDFDQTELLQNLTQLQALSLGYTNITELKGLDNLTQLQSLLLNSTNITELKGLDNLTQLQSLSLGWTNITEFKELDNLTQLQTLNLNHTQITEFNGLDNLTQLQILDLSWTKITELKSLCNLTRLKSVELFNTNITELKGLAHLTQLQSLNIGFTKICKLKELEHFRNLKHLDLTMLTLDSLPESLLNQTPIDRLICCQSTIGNIPSEILSTHYGDNCLDRVKAYFASLTQGAEPITDLKLMVLGNGQIGKTQLCRRLCGEDFDETIDSTHGVLIRQTDFALSDGENIKLKLWDFGGQEIYHGTHSLFFGSRQTVFLLVWHPESNEQTTHDVKGMQFRDYPFRYWLEQIKQHNRHNSQPIAVIVAQAQCDGLEVDQQAPPFDGDLYQEFPFVKVIATSAKNPKGIAELKFALQRAADFYRQQQAHPPVAKAWLRVKDQIEQWITEDSARPEKHRRHRLLSQPAFKDLCQGRGDDYANLEPNLLVAENAIETLLHMLHHSGVVFYKPGLFNDQILLDQSWALNAIYAVFHRDQAITQIRRNNGKFYEGDLGLWLWNEQGYSQEDQAQLIKMMESCGVCFSYWQEGARTYVVPELLPERSDTVIQDALSSIWQLIDAQATASVSYQVDIMHSALFNRILAMIGQEARTGAVYWKDGLQAFETRHNSWLLFERKMQDAFNGEFCFSARGGDAHGLIADLKNTIAYTQQHWNVQLVEVERERPNKPEQKGQALDFDSTPPQHKLPEVCLSYNWRQESLKVVEQFCQRAREKNIPVVRDCDALKNGDSLSQFMRRIGKGKCVVVVLSDGYLKSPNCMFELYEIWRNSMQDIETFRQRVKAFKLDDVEIHDSDFRQDRAIYWKEKYDKKKARVDKYSIDILGVRDLEEYKRIGDFVKHVSDILWVINDTLNPQNIDQLLDYSLDGLKEEMAQPTTHNAQAPDTVL